MILFMSRSVLPYSRNFNAWGKKKKKTPSGRMGTLLKLRGDQEPKLLFIEQWLGLVLHLTGMLSTGKAKSPLKAKLGNYTFTRNLGRRNRQNLVGHILFCQWKNSVSSSAMKSWGGSFANFHTKMTLYSEMLTPEFQPLKRCKGNGNLNE